MSLKRVPTGDKDIQAIQDNVDRELTLLQRAPMAGGVLLEDIALTLGQANPVPHTLQREPKKWIVVRLDTNSVVWETDADDRFLTLWCSASCTVSLWVA